MAFGAVGQPEQEIVDLQYQLIEAFRLASPDDKHVAFHLSQLLSRVFPSIPHQPPPGLLDPHPPLIPVDSNAIEETFDTQTEPNPVNPYLQAGFGNVWLNSLNGMDNNQLSGSHHSGNMDFNPLDWDTGIVSGFGYDPSSIVSDIEQMLAAGDGQMPNVFQGL